MSTLLSTPSLVSNEPQDLIGTIQRVASSLSAHPQTFGTTELAAAFLQVLTLPLGVHPAVVHRKDGRLSLIGTEDQARNLGKSVETWWSAVQADGLPWVLLPQGAPDGPRWCLAHPVCSLQDEEYYLALLGSDEVTLKGLAPFMQALATLLGGLLSVSLSAGTPQAGNLTPAPPELLRELLRRTLSAGASDLHLKVGTHPVLRLHGELQLLTEYPILSPNIMRALFEAMASPQQMETFLGSGELDFAYTLEEAARFRVNASRQRGSLSLALRVIPNAPPEWTTLGIPEICMDLVRRRAGLVLVTGPTGSGKSTTLAALINFINQNQSLRIITIEDPIEFMHQDQKSHVIQRQVGDDTASFPEGLRRALRQDPDVILIGEMRDLETISTALTAAETGHLVLATLHTGSAAQTVERITDVFPAAQQPQVRLQLSSVLAGIMTQRLLRRADEQGRVAAFEIMLATPAIRNLIREAKLHEIPSYISMNAKMGMRTLEQFLAEQVRQGTINIEEARETANDRTQLDTLLGPGANGLKARVFP